MDEHPFSPLQESKGAAFPSTATLEERGRTWRKASDEYLIGFVMQSWGTDSANQTPAVMEMQRRLMVAVQVSGDCASIQTAEVIKLTDKLRALTWVLVGVGIVTIVLMLWKG